MLWSLHILLVCILRIFNVSTIIWALHWPIGALVFMLSFVIVVPQSSHFLIYLSRYLVMRDLLLGKTLSDTNHV